MEETHCGWIGGLWVIGLEETQTVDRRIVGGARTDVRERVTCVWRALLCGAQSQLSLESVREKCKSFEGKINFEMVLQIKRVILQSTRKLISV